MNEEGRIKIHVQQHIFMIVRMLDLLLFAIIIMKHRQVNIHEWMLS